MSLLAKKIKPVIHDIIAIYNRNERQPVAAGKSDEKMSVVRFYSPFGGHEIKLTHFDNDQKSVTPILVCPLRMVVQTVSQATSPP